MNSHFLADHLAFVDAVELADGRCGWSAVVVLSSGTRVATGQLGAAIRSTAMFAAVAEALRLLPPDGYAELVIPTVQDASFEAGVASAMASSIRSGDLHCRSSDSLPQVAARFSEVARNMAEVEAHRVAPASL